MFSLELIDEIEALVGMHQEGSYWDFKREWYGHNKDGDMLIDIICMANNLVNRDAYIIIGVDEESNYAIRDVSQDTNRRNTQMLTDFIRGKKFAGDFRPVVTVEPVYLDGGLVDVIVIHNSTNTPYYLKEKGIRGCRCAKGFYPGRSEGASEGSGRSAVTACLYAHGCADISEICAEKT